MGKENRQRIADKRLECVPIKAQARGCGSTGDGLKGLFSAPRVRGPQIVEIGHAQGPHNVGRHQGCLLECLPVAEPGGEFDGQHAAPQRARIYLAPLLACLGQYLGHQLVYRAGCCLGKLGQRCLEGTAQAARLLCSQCKEQLPTLIGPAPCFVARLRGRFRWQIIVRAADVHPLLRDVALPPGWTIDVDPVTTL